MALTTGDIIDEKYRIVRLIGEGGMGAVYEGENLRIHRTVAIKVLHAGVAENADAVQRFEREAQAAGRIGSEHIVEVLDLGNLANGDRYMVMEFLDGESLSDRIQGHGRLTPAQLYPIARQMLEGLAAAHGAGIIHRDLKPDNVYLLKGRRGQADFAKILDFGISKFSQLSGDSGFSMTRTGAVMGTPYYMSPEQAKGAKNMDHRADLYAVGVILYESVTGQVPFNADTFNELLFKIVLEHPQPVEKLVPDIDPGFAAIIAKGMARDAAHRYQSAEEFQQALDGWAQTGVGPVDLPSHPGMPAPRPSAMTPGQPIQTGTPGVWSSSGTFTDSGSAQPALQKNSRGGMFAAIGAVVLVLVGGGAAAALHFRATAAAARAQAARAAASAAAEHDAEQKAAEEEAAKQKAALDQAIAEKKKLEQEAADAQKKADSEKSASKKAAAEEEAKQKEAEAEAAANKKKAALEAFQKAQRAATKSAPPATTATSKGRVIRTQL